MGHHILGTIFELLLFIETISTAQTSPFVIFDQHETQQKRCVGHSSVLLTPFF